MLKISELQNLAPEELEDKASELKKQLMQFRFQSKTGKLERQSSIREVRRDIARILTIMNAKSTKKHSGSAAKSGGKNEAKS